MIRFLADENFNGAIVRGLMSEEGHLFGCIVGAGTYYVGAREFEFVTLHNLSIIAKLPQFVDLSQVLVSASIFNVPFYNFSHDRNMYRHQMITFGMSVNHFDIYLEDWILQFEDLLRQLYWEEAYAYITAEFALDHEQYHWKANFPESHKNPPEPVTSWVFKGGPRGFRDNKAIW